MDTSITVHVFDWRGDLWLAVDRVGRHAGRRYAPRTRLASVHAQPMREVSEDEALLWMLDVLTLWVNAGAPTSQRADAQRPRRPQVGATGDGAPTCAWGAVTLPSENLPPPPMAERRAERVSDGLVPEGITDHLF